MTFQNSLASCSFTLFRNFIASSLRSFYTSFINDSISLWWKTQTEYILRDNDLQIIRLLCRYRTHRNSSTSASILRTKWTSILNNSLLQMSAETFNRSHVDDMNLNQKMKKILTRLESSRSDDKTWWHSTLSATLSQSNASNVVSKLNEKSLSRFESITFLNYVRETLYLNENVLSLKTFKDWHDDLFNQIFDRLENFFEDRKICADCTSECSRFNIIRSFNDFNDSDCLKKVRCIERSVKVCCLHCFIVRTWNLRLNSVLKWSTILFATFSNIQTRTSTKHWNISQC